MDHVALRELAAGAALDDLDPLEREALDGHLRTCEPCRGLAVDLRDVFGELAFVAPERTPPADLRDHVLGALRETTRADDAPALAVIEGSADRHRGARPDRPAWAGLARAGLAVAAGLAVVAFGVGIGRQQLTDELAVTRQELGAARAALTTQGTALTVAADPGHRTVPLEAEPIAPAAHAQVMYRPGTTEAVLMATDLPATPPGRVYQLWYADAAGVHALGTYRFDGNGPFVAPFGVDLGSSAAAMVTLEPEGGATGDPGPQVVSGEL